MPSFKEHYALKKLFYGEAFARKTALIDVLMDHPWCELYGPQHQKFMHSLEACGIMEFYFGPLAGEACRIHIYCDLLFSKTKKRKDEKKKKR